MQTVCLFFDITLEKPKAQIIFLNLLKTEWKTHSEKGLFFVCFLDLAGVKDFMSMFEGVV